MTARNYFGFFGCSGESFSSSHFRRAFSTMPVSVGARSPRRSLYARSRSMIVPSILNPVCSLSAFGLLAIAGKGIAAAMRVIVMPPKTGLCHNCLSHACKSYPIGV